MEKSSHCFEATIAQNYLRQKSKHILPFSKFTKLKEIIFSNVTKSFDLNKSIFSQPFMHMLRNGQIYIKNRAV